MDNTDLKIFLNENVLHGKGFIDRRKLSNLPKEVVRNIGQSTGHISNDLLTQITAILGEYTEKPVCLECSKEVPLYPKYVSGRHILTDRVYCSRECNRYSKVAKEKREQTNLERYGERNIFSTTQGKESIRKTLINKYGVDNPQKNKLINQKTQNTLKANYGGVGTASLIIQEKGQNTLLEKTGYRFSAQHPDNRNKLAEVVTSHIDPDSLSKLQDIEYLKEQNYRYKKPIVQIAKELKVTPRSIHARFEKEDVPINEEISTSYEQRTLQNFLKSLGLELITNSRSIIYPKELDIYIPTHNIAIEYNGLYNHTEISGEKSKQYHIDKTTKCQEKNIQLIQIFSNEWLEKPEIVKSILKSKLNIYDTIIYARKCEIKEVASREAKEFLNSCHLQGYKTGKVRLGLYCDSELVSIMTFSNRQRDGWELDRFCSKLNTKVIGAASKLFKAFVNSHPNEKVVSYCDLRYGTGGVYKALGFKKLRVSSPNYWYTKNFKTLESRIKYQKHKLENLLSDYDKELTEWENMRKHGFDRIHDCGNLVYLYG